jgi:vancomycin permeability regulator SanA
MKATKKKFFIFIKILILWFFIHTGFIVFDGLNDEIEEVDVAVILGNKVELDGSPSDRLKARLDKAVELSKEGYFPYIIVSGGVGEEGFDEAKVMKDYLVHKNIPVERIIEDPQGYNTMLTAENTKNIMAELELSSVMVISQYFHIPRVKLVFKKFGFDQVYSAHAEYFEPRDIYSTIREFPAYYKYLLQ